MKILQKIFIPIVIFILLFSNVGFNIVKHTCGTSGSVNISLYFEEVCSDDSCVEVEEVTEVHCCDSEKVNIENTDSHINLTNEIKCCNNVSKEISSIVEFTITTSPNIDFVTKVVIAESFDHNITKFNQDYEILIDNITNKIKDLSKITLKFLLQQIFNSNSDSDDYSI